VVETPPASPGSDRAPALGSQGIEIQLWTIMLAGLVGIAALTLIGIFLILRERRRTAVEERLALVDEARRPPARQVRPRAEWEDYALDDLPLGTVEYEPVDRPH
jgi:hypothetical protein